MRTPQRPLPSGFGPATSAADVLGTTDLSGRVVIVTGGYSGIGLEAARVLAAAGAQVIVPARSPDKARAALAPLRGVAQEQLDLMDPASIDGFAARFLETRRPLHALIDSAGIMAAPLTRDGRGYESQFATNHLGHFQLAARLWPALVRAGGARVVSVSSRGHRRAAVDFADPNFERRPYDRWLAYGQSKTANVLFAVGLDRRGEPHGVRALALHPGAIATDLGRYMTREEWAPFLDESGQPKLDPVNGLKTVEQGAATSVWCAVSPQLDGKGGVYCEDCDIAEAVPADSPSPRGVRPYATDPELAEQLWSLSERLTGLRFAP